ncbi:UDP-rhamnose/UDP-galactose transporter 1-like [Dendrobium catenatum]|uniref:UDP-galactose transporter 2 n=1 Tax=Dendrobium catenatum TaxID=906689 RepID=A0A2I0WLS7_9ASPA|nr:UDP-rhamnose/UDP-galactose transporter 1-like [Dendrobium catenatum]PKU76614.1 UDP-galactose transporter 2 [Dendrobium catenatum]
MDSEKKPRVSNAGAWGMNVVSSVGIIMANKQLMSPSGYGFSFATTLTGFHFSVTALVGWVSNAAGLSVSKQIPLWELLWFSIVANLSITAMNLSLMLNSVGFYQISKLSIIPVVCMLEWILNNKNYSSKVIMSVVVVAFGVGICTVTDVEINMKGFLCACVAVFCTSLQQITIGSFQKKYSIGSFELLSKTAPIQAASLIVLGPFMDYCLNGQSILKYHFSTGALFFIILSCTLAVFCNMSQYLCIGRFSATTFQVLGHMKTVCVLILGWILFDSALTIKNILGMLLAVVGMIVYSWAVESEKLAKLAASAISDEENVKLLKDRSNGVTESDVELGQTKS